MYDSLETKNSENDRITQDITIDTFSSTSQLIPNIENDNSGSSKKPKDNTNVSTAATKMNNENTTDWSNGNEFDSQTNLNSTESQTTTYDYDEIIGSANVKTSKKSDELYRLAKEYKVSKKVIKQCKIDSHQLQNFKSIFDYIDTDSSNSIEVEEIVTLLKRIGEPLTRDEISNLMQKVDLDGNGELEFSEFLVMMAGSLSLQFNKKELTQAFQFFSQNNQNASNINIDDLRFALTMLHPVTRHGYKRKDNALFILTQKFNQFSDQIMQETSEDMNDESEHAHINAMLDERVKRTDINELLESLDPDIDGHINIEHFLDNIM